MTEHKKTEPPEVRGIGTEIAGQVVGGIASGAAAVAAQQALGKLTGSGKPKNK